MEFFKTLKFYDIELKKHLRRKMHNPGWGNFRQTKPISRVFGFDWLF